MVRPSLVRTVISGVPSIGSEKSRTISSGPVVSRAPLAGDVRTKKLCADAREVDSEGGGCGRAHWGRDDRIYSLILGAQLRISCTRSPHGLHIAAASFLVRMPPVRRARH